MVEGGCLGERKAEASLWHRKRQDSAENPHRPLAAALEAPVSIYKN